VQFLGGRDDTGGGQSGGFTPRSDVPVDTGDFSPAPVGGGSPAPAPAPADDDIPF
jgi:single-strand DNA-binding protein